VSSKAKTLGVIRPDFRTVLAALSHYLTILRGGLVEIFSFGLGENSQNFNQVACCAPGCLSGSMLHALAKSVSEFRENPFVARITDLRLRPCPDGSFRFENTVFHLPVPDRQRLVFFAEQGLKKGFDQWVLHRKPPARSHVATFTTSP
jgi:hypothetical protein